MINCYLIGELSTVEALRENILSYPSTHLMGYSFSIPESVDFFLQRPDIVFIDSSLLVENTTWMERMRQFASVIVVSADTLKAYEAFEYLAFDYLIKPVSFNRFVKSINKFDHLTQLARSVYRNTVPEPIESFFIKPDSKSSREIVIRCDELIYIQAMQNYVILHLEGDRRFPCHNSMKEMEESLAGSSFSRIHKSFIINDNKITSIEGNTVTLNHSDVHCLLIGTTYRKAFFEKKNEKMIRRPKLTTFFTSFSTPASLIMVLGFLFGEITEGINLVLNV